MAREITVHVNLSRAQVRKQLLQLPAILTGSSGTAGVQARTVQVRLGLATLQVIADAFKVKREGNTDAGGLRWVPLAPYTLKARKRKGIQHELILVEKGDLEKSLTPAQLPEQASAAVPAQPLQVFRVERGKVEVGTEREWALEQHEGRPQRRPPLPQRRLWPELSQWPASWWDKILGEVQQGVTKVALYLVGR